MELKKGKYSVKYQLEFNPAKSSVMKFRSVNDVTTTYDPLDIKMNDIKIKTCDSEKYLGFNIKQSINLFEFKNIINDMKVKTNFIFTSLKIQTTLPKSMFLMHSV